MKKIKSIKQLRAEKKQIKQRQTELEEKLRINWKELKEHLRPVDIAKDALNSVTILKTADNLYGNSFVRNTFTYGVALLANMLLNKVGNK